MTVLEGEKSDRAHSWAIARMRCGSLDLDVIVAFSADMRSPFAGAAGRRNAVFPGGEAADKRQVSGALFNARPPLKATW